jgi:hypothetical protein
MDREEYNDILRRLDALLGEAPRSPLVQQALTLRSEEILPYLEALRQRMEDDAKRFRRPEA